MWSDAGLLEALSVEVGEVEDDDEEEEEEEEGDGEEDSVSEEGERVGESGVFSLKGSVFLRRLLPSSLLLLLAGDAAGAGGLEEEANMCRERDVSWSFISLCLCDVFFPAPEVVKVL